MILRKCPLFFLKNYTNIWQNGESFDIIIVEYFIYKEWMVNMNKYRIVIIAIILCLFTGNVAYALMQGKRQGKLYTANNEMQYEKPTEEPIVADNEESIIQPNTEFTTEEPMTTEETKQDKKEPDKGKKKKKPSKNKGKENDTTAEETENGEGEEVPTTNTLVRLEYSWSDAHSLLYGKELNRNNIYVTGIFDNGDKESVSIENCTIEGFDSKKLGAGTCKISYYGVSVDAAYTILNYEVSIYCGTWDKRNLYRYGDAFSKTDLTVFAKMADGTNEQIAASDYDVEGLDTKKLGNNSCKIKYKDFAITESYQVHNYAVKLTSTIERFVVRGDVSFGELVQGQSVTVTMADGEKRELSTDEYEILGYSTKKDGDFTLTLQYEDVLLHIPYKVYYDILQIDLGEEQDAVQSVFFTENLTITSQADLPIDETYVSKKDGKTYRLVGVYTDSKCKKELEYPKTYDVTEGFRINRSSMQWHNYYLYLKYEVVPEEDSSEEDSSDEDTTQEDVEDETEGQTTKMKPVQPGTQDDKKKSFERNAKIDRLTMTIQKIWKGIN